MPNDAKHQSAPLGKKVQMSAKPFRVAPIRTCPAPAAETDLLGSRVQPGSLSLGEPTDGLMSKSDDQVAAEAAASGLLSNATTLHAYSRVTVGEVSLAECAFALTESALAVHRGDLTGPEIMLAAQAVALNSIFCELARRASLNMGERLDAMDRYMRLALKAQGQCRVTIEALHEMKNPRPVAFVQQANISNGGQQLVNNATPPLAPAKNSGTAQNELLEVPHGNQLDIRAQDQAGRTDPHLETLGAGNRAAHC